MGFMSEAIERFVGIDVSKGALDIHVPSCLGIAFTRMRH
jgi:hypothetical protein